ncbi:MAG TPA: type III-A CRISPR-associated protein Cas10/Csm1, partial [Clostridia bacterium]|nr:type III-A CRISPR-associated protein Cas10/Csm1 [Clostridia bacterium]
EDIIGLNNGGLKKEERECRECYKSGEVSDEGKCEICQALIELSPRIIREDSVFVVKDKFEKILPRATLALPFNRSITLKSIDDARKDNYVRVYSKNQPSMGQSFATNLWIGDYSVKSNKGLGSKDFEEFAKESKGIDRVAVLRADVDDLGKAFISGFKDQKDGIVVKNSMRKYETISRTSTLSRHLSMFFKFYINKILKDYNRNALIVYSGGDDMFIAGSWDDIIDLAKDIRDAFIRYTQGTLTLSAGIGIYNHSYPISRMATEVGDLENAAKVKDEDKNKVTLFREGRVDEYNKTIDEDWVLSWGQLPSFTPQEDEAGTNISITNSGIQEKLDMLNKTFKRDKQNGKAFLYKMLEFIRECQSDKINIARYAYLLRRAEERNKNLDVTTFYKWIQDSNGRKELEVAITLYSYLTRK